VCLYIQSRAHQQQQQRCVSFLPAHTHTQGGLFCLASSSSPAAAAVVVVLSSSRIGFKANKIWRPFFFFFYSQLVCVCTHTLSSHLQRKKESRVHCWKEATTTTTTTTYIEPSLIEKDCEIIAKLQVPK
jgi:hypothetical protein